jgi:hypothetical protein
MSKSVEARLKETEAAKVALETEVAKLAGENDTYTNRMKEMEDNISQAMKRMAEMEAKMEEYAKMKATFDEKVVQTSANLQEMIESEQEDEEEGEDADKMAGNVIEGVNEKVIAGQKKKGKKAKKSAEEVAPTPVAEEAKPEVKAEEVKPEAKAEVVAEPAKVEEVAPTKVAEVVAPAPVAQEAAPAPVAKDVVKDVVEALISEKVAEVTSKFAMAQTKFNELDAELVKAKETLALEAKVKEAAMATVAGLQAKYEALLAKVSGIESNTKTVEEKVAKQVADLGVEPVVAAVESVGEVREKTAEEILAEFEAMTDAKAKRAFYKKHEQSIVSAVFPKKR